MDLVQLLRQVLIIEPGIRRRHEAAHLVKQRGRQAPRRGPAPAAMGQGGGAPRFEPALQASHLPQTDPECPRDLPAREAAGTRRADQSRPMYFLAIQREGLH